MMALAILAAAWVTPRAAAQAPEEQSAGERVERIADEWYRETLQRTPEVAYLTGIEIDRHDGLQDNRLAAESAWQRSEDRWLAELDRLDVGELYGHPQWITFGMLRETLEASIGLRVCRESLWGVNQMAGWQLRYAQIAALQPVGEPELRSQALSRWSKLPGFVGNEISNLREGLRRGYSSPQSNVRLVIGQLDELLALDTGDSPFYSPAARDGDAAFAARMAALIENDIVPALREYRRFLSEEYLPRARQALAVSALPDGEACYRASLRSYTTLSRPPREVYALGMRSVGENRARVVALGRQLYGLEDFGQIIERTRTDPVNRFESAEALLEFSRAVVERAGRVVPDWFGRVPQQPVVVEPFPAYQDGTGVSARYEPGSAATPGVYRITLYQPEEQRRGDAEITAVHEAWPGHHLQVAIAQHIDGLHRMSALVFNSGFVEGWARYAESLSEEMGLYETGAALISRRAWPARGMVVDPGLHVLGWSREQAIEFIMESGRFTRERAEQMVDRIAILPGQLTAYDSGALEIFALRREAQAALGGRFDVAQFHDRLLENGSVPLWMLRAHIERWVRQQGAAETE